MTDPLVNLLLGRTELPKLLTPSVAALLAPHGERLAQIKAEEMAAREEHEAALTDFREAVSASAKTTQPVPTTDAPIISLAPFEQARRIA